MPHEDTYTNSKNAETWWSGSSHWQRMLANQVHARMAYFDSISPTWEGLQTLDLGCAGGYMAEALAHREARVIGIDPWTKVLNVAHEHALGSKLDIAYLSGVGEFLPLADNSIDRVVCVDVIEHVQDLPRVLSEIYRVLRPEGILFFDTVNHTWLSRLFVVEMAETTLHLLPRGTHDCNKFRRPKELRFLLKHLGFKVGPMHGMGPALGINKRLDLALGKLPSSAVMYSGYAVKMAPYGRSSVVNAI